MGKTILLTGATGYVGKAVCKELLAQGHHLHILFRRKEKIKDGPFAQNCTLHNGDLLDLKPLEGQLTHVDAVIHLAADTRLDSPDGSISQTNITGTENLLKFCVRVNSRPHFIFMSSIEANGPSGNKVTTLADVPEPLSEYGRSKITGENLVREYSQKYDFPFTVLRLGNVYDETSGWFYHFKRVLKENGKRLKLLYYYAPAYTLHFIHLKEIGQSVVSILGNGTTFQKTYFLASESYSVKEVLDTLSGALEIPIPKIAFKPLWHFFFKMSLIRKTDGLISYICAGAPGRIFRTYDISQNQKDFGFKPQDLYLNLLKHGIE